MPVIQGAMNAEGKHFAIVVSRWNEFVTRELLNGAIETLHQHNAGEPLVIWVPGTWEIPPVASRALHEGVDGVIALGCILQGATSHAHLLAADVSRALMDLQVASGRPVTWGILTPDSSEQAVERAGMKLGNKGREATLAAIELASVLQVMSASEEDDSPSHPDSGVI
ncbi:MAG: 6,7-dimethyl-8-ribityllumazine synthase [Fimbriimonadaceae bacterium]|nr:6,7-dimethyl-8-ribityllumazine synthase [Fimbriimonadaceae bacterium]